MVWLAFQLVLVTVLWRTLASFDKTQVQLISLTRQDFDFASYKAWALIPVLVFLTVVSLVNFAFAFFASMLLVPFYAPIAPTRYSLFNGFQYFLLLLVSPLAFLLALQVLGLNPGNFLWDLYRQHVDYGTLAYPFIVLICLPLNLSHFKLLSLRERE